MKKINSISFWEKKDLKELSQMLPSILLFPKKVKNLIFNLNILKENVSL
jgi:hypothetical protein